jgi:hypothetical protein
MDEKDDTRYKIFKVCLHIPYSTAMDTSGYSSGFHFSERIIHLPTYQHLEEYFWKGNR